MAKKTIQVDVSDAAYGVGIQLVAFVGHVQKALADGYQPGQDIPEILKSAIADLVPIVQKVPEIPADFAADKASFFNGLMLGISGLINKFVK